MLASRTAPNFSGCDNRNKILSMDKLRDQLAVRASSPAGAQPAKSKAALRGFVPLFIFALAWQSSCLAQSIQFLNANPSVYENGTNVSVIVTRTPATGL